MSDIYCKSEASKEEERKEHEKEHWKAQKEKTLNDAIGMFKRQTARHNALKEMILRGTE